MTPEIEALARRAVACVPIERWPDWTPVECAGDRGIVIPSEYVIVLWDDEDGYAAYATRQFPDAVPLLDTPAGLGALLAVAREAWSERFAHLATTVVIWTESGDRLSYGVDGVDHGGGTEQIVEDYREPSDGLCWSEAEALVSALESAP